MADMFPAFSVRASFTCGVGGCVELDFVRVDLVVQRGHNHLRQDQQIRRATVILHKLRLGHALALEPRIVRVGVELDHLLHAIARLSDYR